MWQKFGDAVDGVNGDASKDVFKPGEGLDIHTLTGSYETAQHCSCPTADVTAKKRPVAATHAFVNLIWPHFDHYIWPHPKADKFLSLYMVLEGRAGA